jgi:hypothetical protein
MKRVTGAVLFLLVFYAADTARLHYKIAKSQDAVEKVQISLYYAVPQKNNRVEFYSGDSRMEECVHALFPHQGDNPCWYVQRHKEERIDE